DDVRQTLSCEDTLPQIIGFEPVRVGGITSAVVPAEIERQEPRSLALQMRAEAHFVIVHREVCDAAPKLEKLLARVAVAFVLLYRVFDGLFGKTVLQLECRDGQPIDEKSQIEGELRLVPAVSQLSRDAEAISLKPFLCLFVARRRCSVEELEMMRPVFDTIA